MVPTTNVKRWEHRRLWYLLLMWSTESTGVYGAYYRCEEHICYANSQEHSVTESHTMPHFRFAVTIHYWREYPLGNHSYPSLIHHIILPCMSTRSPLFHTHTHTHTTLHSRQKHLFSPVGTDTVTFHWDDLEKVLFPYSRPFPPLRL